MGSSHSTLTPPQLSDQVAKRGFPPVIQARLKKSWTRITVNLNEPGAEPSYCATLPEGWFGTLTLHDGPNETDAPLAHCEMKGKWLVENIISLPPPTTGDAALSGKEILRYKFGKKERFWFAMDVGEGANRRVEKFEWRHSRGKEVRSVGQGSFGWKLVRLAPGDLAEGERDEKDEEKAEYYEDEAGLEDEGAGGSGSSGLTSDGKEVVAVWADASLRKLSASNVGELQFRGSGATGEFGTRWALMVVITCLSMWQKVVAAASVA